MKGLYDPNTFPLLAEKYARQGLSDTQIAANLGIVVGTFYKYQNEHIEFKEAIKRGKKPVDIEVENKLLKRALGYQYTEEQREIEMIDGQPVIKKIKTTTKEVAPDVGAIAFWLKNRNPNDWKERKEIDINDKKLTPEEIKQELKDIGIDID